MLTQSTWRSLLIPGLLLSVSLTGSVVADEKATDGPSDIVSYHKQVRPIFQAHCQGCHQPAKSRGEFVMTAFDRLLKGGESGDAAIVPGNPDESYLIEQITATDGEALMPPDKKPLSKVEVELIRKWIAQGAKDDTPENARQRFDQDNPPEYVRPPFITSIDYSPDGQLIAISGFHEVLLYKADGSQPVGRLVGMSERIESVSFSPDGKRLAVSGGLPARMGEVQIWDVAKRKLELSVPVTYDTIYGASWSPDGSKLSFGCADTTIRVIDAKTGKQVLYQGAHDDWVLDTVFSAKGTHVISVGRDMTVKLTEVATERFIDNITSITPGALKGGIQSIDVHPERDEVLVGGSDGIPKIFRVFRTSKRVIGDNANLIRQFPPMSGRIFGVDISADGSRIVAGSSLNGSGEIRIFAYDFDTNIPADLKKILEKRTQQRSADEQKKVDAFRRDGTKVLSEIQVPESGIYSVQFSPDGKTVVAAGSDGKVRLVDVESGKIRKSFLPVTLQPAEEIAERGDLKWRDVFFSEETPEENLKLTAISIDPPQIELTSRYQSVQLQITGTLESGDMIDLTRQASIQGMNDVVSLSPSRTVRPAHNGVTQLTVAAGGQMAELTVEVTGLDRAVKIDYVRDVMPVVSKLGCNAGTCHGAKDGKNGFKLSLRGYDPLFDVRAFTDDHGGRRVNLASPDDSLMLMKATGAVAHVGGQLTLPGEPDYEIIREWVAAGAKLDSSTPRVERIELLPTNPVVQKIGGRQQMRVMAHYADGEIRDVTNRSFIESGNMDIAASNKAGLVTVLRRGEAPVLARFEGAYAATTITGMGDRSGFEWKTTPEYNFVDKHVYSKLQRMRTLPADVCTDAEFVRRIHLDLTGLPPTSEDVRKFIADKRDSTVKRNELIEKLIGNKDFVEFWTNKWADLLQVNRKYLGAEGAKSFRAWIRDEVDKNTPYNEFAYSILTANGSNKENPAASYYKILRTPAETMENTTHLFLAVRFNCNKCHDHPFERWTQDQYYETSAYFARLGLKADPASGKNKIGGTAVEGAKPLYEIVYEKDAGEVTHDRTGKVTPPAFPFDCDFEDKQDATRRDKLAAWITSADNQYFASSYVNRVWGYMLGVGLIEPLDDIRAGNPPTNPELLDELTQHFIDSGFDVRSLMRTICRSRTYQHSIRTNEWNEDDTINYSHAKARRLPAEVLFDAMHAVTGSKSKIPGVPEGTRAVEIPDAGIRLPNGFLANFGRPARESSCECERSSDMQLGPVMALVSGPTLGNAISDSNNELTKLVASQPDDQKLIEEIFLRILSRPASEQEVASAIQLMRELPANHSTLKKTLADYETKLKPIRERLEKERVDRIAKADQTLKAYQAEIKPREEKLDREQKERTANLEAELAAYDKSIPDRSVAWEANQDEIVTRWHAVNFKAMKATNGATLKRESDGSIFVSGQQGKGAYVLDLDTTLTNITGVRIEALTDDRLPKKGPGRSPDGNIVLSEFVVKAASITDAEADPKKIQKVKLQNAKATFSQAGYDVKTAIDDKQPPQNNGWAISPQIGKRQVATFEFQKPISNESGTRLTLELHQVFNSGHHALGRFRITLTTAKAPLDFEGLPAEIASIVDRATATRTIDQRLALIEYFRSIDPELKKKKQAVAESKKPRPIDPKLKQLQDTLAYMQRPVPPDDRHEELKKAVALSDKQMQNQRLTAVQDLAWALINSPSFLFNR